MVIPAITEIGIREDFLTATVDEATVTYTFERSGSLDYDVLIDLDGSTPTPGFVFNDFVVTMPAGQSEVAVPIFLSGADGSTDVRFDFEIEASDQYSFLLNAEVPASEEHQKLLGIRDSIVITDGDASGLFIGDDGVDMVGGKAFGDPHLITFDNVAYDFQATGEFLLARATSGSPYEIHIRTKPVFDRASYIEAVATEIEGNKISYDNISPEAPVLRINGIETPIPAVGASIAVGTGSIANDADGLVVNYPSGETLTITGFSSFLSLHLGIDQSRPLGSFEGLLGNADGNPSNDLALADGTVLATPVPVETLYGPYAASWVLDAATSLLDGPSTPYLAPGDTISIDQLPADLLEAAIAAVDAVGIDNPILREAAILDFVLTGDIAAIDAAAAADQIADPIIDTVPIDASKRGLISISADQDARVEGNSGSKTFTFTVSRPESDLPLDVNYAVSGSGGAPASANDFFGGLLPAGIVSFAAGETSQTISIEVAGDTANEPDESFSVNLSLSPEASQFFDFFNASTSSVITNDDGAVTASFLDNDAEQEFMPIIDGGTFGSPTFEGVDLGIAAFVPSDSPIQGLVQKISLDLDGPIDVSNTEFSSPYSLFGNPTDGDYSNGRPFPQGEYKLSVDPIGFDGASLGVSVFDFTIVDYDVEDITVSFFDIANRQEYSRIADGAVFNASELAGVELGLAAYVVDGSGLEPRVHKINLDLDGPIDFSNTEFVEPYSLFGNPDIGDFASGIEFLPGQYELKVEPITRDGTSLGTTEFDFIVA